MSSVSVFSQCQCAVTVPNLQSITSSSPHCASPEFSVSRKHHFKSSYGLSLRSAPWSESGASKLETIGQSDSCSSSGSARVFHSQIGGAFGRVDGSSCRDLETFVVWSSQQMQQRREMLRTISSWILLPALANAGSPTFGAAAAEDDEPPSPETSTTPEEPAKIGLVERLLERSKANKAKYDQERLDSYYRRNFKDYFEFLKGGIQDKDKTKLTEAEKGILAWLEKNQ